MAPRERFLTEVLSGGKAPSHGMALVKNARRFQSPKAKRAKKSAPFKYQYHGAGGNGSWVKPIVADAKSRRDCIDLNYGSCEESYQMVWSNEYSIEEYKKNVGSLIEELFSTGYIDVAASNLKKLGSSEFLPYFVERLVSMAMYQDDEQKEMASVLLSALSVYVISSAQISQGFLMLLESADDLALDISDAVVVLALFLSRAVVDDVLPLAFLSTAKKSLARSSKGHEVIHTAEKSYLFVQHRPELVDGRWGGNTNVTVEGVKRKIFNLLKEYVQSGNAPDACRCIRELRVASSHHEVARRALAVAMEIQTAEPLILKLLKKTYGEGLIGSSHVVKGCSRLADSLDDDLALDIPSVETLYQSFVPKAISDDSLLKSPAQAGGGDDNLKHYKEEIVTIIRDYFLSGNIPELTRDLVDLGLPEYNPLFFKKLVTLAMDRTSREKEMASVLISSLYFKGLSTEQDIIGGFILLLGSAEDNTLGTLDASSGLGDLFLARAVTDRVLTPQSLEQIGKRLTPNSRGSKTVHMARFLVAAKHAAIRQWWGRGDWAVKDAKEHQTF